MGNRIEITGLREFQRSLKQAETGVPKMLRVVFNEATGIVIDYAQAHIDVKTGRARASLKARSSQRTAAIALGGRRAPYAAWLDFGGEGRVSGRPGRREFIKDGRYVYKGLELHREDVTESMARGLAQLARDAGLEVT
jgi:hypothetical protein